MGKDKKKGLFNITRSKEADKKTTIEIISFILLLNKIKVSGKAVEYYYDFINENFVEEITNDDFLNKIKFHKEQLSSSCTFFGFYYNFFYINTKYNLDINE